VNILDIETIYVSLLQSRQTIRIIFSIIQIGSKKYTI